MRVALLGYGTVGLGVYEMLRDRTDVTVAYVLDRVEHPELGRVSTTDFGVILNDRTVDTVIEVIGGLHPAHEYVWAALDAGKNAISANKLMISRYYSELTELAYNKGAALRYTAAVGGGIPWLLNLERVMRVCKVHEVSGIMNGTSNFILDAMQSHDEDFETALQEAQRLGYAERDPSADIDGLDSCCKAILSANIAFSVALDPDETTVCGIRDIEPFDTEACLQLGCVCRLMAYAYRHDHCISLFVEPTFVKQDSLAAAVHKNLNLITFEAEKVGRESFYGYGAGRYPTAYTVVEDCLDLANGVRSLYNNQTASCAIDNSRVSHRYYVRTEYREAGDPLTGANRCGEGYLTGEVTVQAMHTFAARAKMAGKVCWIAGLEE